GDGRYLLELRLGRGGMGDVWRARADGPGGFEKRVAVKFLHAFLADDPEFVTMFLDEAKVATQLNHPNIVQIVELGEQRGHYYLVMEYVEGPSLKQLLRTLGQRHRWIDEGEVLHVMTGLLAALDHAHHAR